MLAELGHAWWPIGALALACVSSPVQSTSAPITGVQSTSAPSTSVQVAVDPKLSCVEYNAEARYSGVGYDHLVHISNHCERTVACEVSTNVNPDKMRVSVASKATETVLTWRGSPAREFAAAVSCRLSE